MPIALPIGPASSRPAANAMQRDLGQAIAESLAAPVGDERDAMAAREQRAGQRLGREHMAAGAAGGEDDEAA